MRLRPFAIVVGVASVLGLVFAAYSTHDFVAHLDRQTHGIHCSFLPGIVSADATGSSGCHVTLMSPYSSIFRTQIWGGLPISLPAMAVFAFLLFWVSHLAITRRLDDTRATGFLLLAATVPLIASIVMGVISFAELGAACKLCIGIYVASALAFGGALGVFLRARKRVRRGEAEAAPTGYGWLAGAALLGVLFVAIPSAAYAANAPDFKEYIGSCGELPNPSDPQDVLVSTGGSGGDVSAVEVLDPLCPACRSFEERLEASALDTRLERKLLLFPLDDQCNWMVDRALHPGACTVSEAVLCADGRANEVLSWAFSHQHEIKKAAKDDPKAAARMVREKFPQIGKCVGSPQVQAELNQALRWAVRNQLPVLTPQLYVEGTKLCDADTDLGMDYMLTHLVGRAETGEEGS